MAAVRRLTGDDNIGNDFAEKWREMDLDERTKSLLTYASKLTEYPNLIEDADIESLLSAGWDQRAIWEATALISFFNMTGEDGGGIRHAGGQTPRGVRIPRGGRGHESGLAPLTEIGRKPMAEPTRISAEELHRKLEEGEPVILVCAYGSELAFKKYNIKQAITATELDSRLPALPKDQEIVFYCACPEDKTALQRASILVDQGYGEAKVLHRGFSAWLTAGFPGGKIP